MSASDTHQPARILIAMPTWVGDAAMATPLLEAIHDQHPGARLDLLMKPYLSGLLQDAPWLGDTIELSEANGWWSLRRQLAERRYDWGVLLSNSFRPALLLWLARVSRRVGYVRNWRGPLLTDRLAWPDQEPFRMVDFYGRIGQTLSVARPVRPLRLYVRGELQQKADELFQAAGLDGDKLVIGINPGAKYGSSKLWPAEYFAETADDLIEHTGGQVVVLAGPGEDTLAEDILRRMRRGGVTLPSHRVGLETLKAVVRKLDLLISNDTGPRHIAAAFGVPTVTVYGPTHVSWGDSGFEKNVDLFIPVDCGPCMQRTCPLKHHKCLVDLRPPRVVQAALQLLGTTVR